MAAKITATGLTEARANLRAMGRRVRDLTPAMQVGAEAIHKLISDSFRQSRGPDGAAWKPLLPATIARRRKGSSKPLLDTGVLANSMTAVAEKRAILFGTNVPYGGVHQFGGGRKAAIPARPFLPVAKAGAGFVLVETGPAAKTFERIRKAIAAYVRGKA